VKPEKKKKKKELGCAACPQSDVGDIADSCYDDLPTVLDNDNDLSVPK
jgi:hypothetical protein